MVFGSDSRSQLMCFRRETRGVRRDFQGMTQTAKAQEPSMEEILASIRRIIADDDTKPAKSQGLASETAAASKQPAAPAAPAARPAAPSPAAAAPAKPAAPAPSKPAAAGT